MIANRRRFLSISAAAIGAGVVARAYTPQTTWRGTALGADVQITLKSDSERAHEVLQIVQKRIAQIDKNFSLYDQHSELSRLNSNGQLENPSLEFVRLLGISRDIHNASFGAFDPSVQSIWRALANGDESRPIGSMTDVSIDREISLKPQMALTLNGIAQGYASDIIHDLLRDHGFTRHLVNVGEYRAGEGRWHMGIENSSGQILGQSVLTQNAIATSSMDATLINGHSHLMSISGASSLWKTVSVQAKSATIADGFSTAMSFLNERQIRDVTAKRDDIQSVWIEDLQGYVQVIS